MSRNGKVPVLIPENVKVSVENSCVAVEGPKGKLKKSFDTSVNITLENDAVVIKPASDKKLARAMHGTARSIIKNMVEGVVTGYSKQLEIHGVGFRANLNGKVLNLQLGYSHDCNLNIPDSITVTVTENTKLKVEGVDKHLVGQITADIKAFYPVEPYKGKGVRIVGQYVRRKEGKKSA